jgi:hypothetical protein
VSLRSFRFGSPLRDTCHLDPTQRIEIFPRSFSHLPMFTNFSVKVLILSRLIHCLSVLSASCCFPFNINWHGTATNKNHCYSNSCVALLFEIWRSIRDTCPLKAWQRHSISYSSLTVPLKPLKFRVIGYQIFHSYFEFYMPRAMFHWYKLTTLHGKKISNIQLPQIHHIPISANSQKGGLPTLLLFIRTCKTELHCCFVTTANNWF